MRLRTAFIFSCTVLCSVCSLAATEYVEVTNAFAKVYEYLDPKSKIIVHAKKGDHFELVYAGTSWYQVKVKDKVGWLERQAGMVTESTSHLPVGSLILFLVILVATFVGVFFLIQRQKNADL